MLRLVVAATLVVFCACGPVPGGRLEGAPASAPSDWSTLFESGRAFCEIQSRPDEPHSIQLDCFVYEGRLYVQSHRWAFSPWWPATSWAEIWLEHPEVDVRVGSSLFQVMAVHVTDASERGPVLETRGYGDPIPEGIALFRFDSRPSS